LEVGNIRNPSVEELVVTTFSGKILTFWDIRTLDPNDPKIKAAKEAKSKQLKEEVTKLREKIHKQQTAKIESSTSAIKPITGENVQPANARLTILPADAAYILAIESQAIIVFFLVS